MATPPIFVIPAFSVPVSVLSASVRLHAQDTEGATDHPMFSRLPGYVITQYYANESGAHQFRTYPEQRVDGHCWNIRYAATENVTRVGPLQIGHHYIGHMLNCGGQRLVDELDTGGGYAVARLPLRDGRSVWLELSVTNGGTVYELTIVEETVVPSDACQS